MLSLVRAARLLHLLLGRSLWGALPFERRAVPGWLLIGCGAAAQLACPSHAHAAGPRLELNRLELVDEAVEYEKFLRRVLSREARRLDWGASADSVIQYRFALQRLSFEVRQDVLTVHCSASGRLPKGLTARSQLSFSGEPARKRELVERVLTIVARGVLTRLAEIERERRHATRNATSVFTE
jgi:hypothetical protein